MIEIDDVTKRYGDVVALDDVSLSVTGGESVGLVGTNGAGKTTLFRLIVGHERPDGGRVRVGGVDPAAGPRVRERVGYLPESIGFQPALTGREVLEFHGEMRALDGVGPRIDTLLGVVGLGDAADRRVGGYSNGMTRRLGLATALLGDPDVLLLDEPAAGLDPGGVDAFNRVVERIGEERDVTVLLSTHVLQEVERLCDRVAVLDDGTLRTVGTVPDVSHAAGDAVTVTARYPDGTDAAAETLRNRFPDVAPSRAGDELELTCDRERVTRILGAVLETDPESVAVDEPGLEAAFRETVDLGGESA
ncbi:MAG: ABC transporter ATP-binding protein [Haloarculaceae archaeon]